MEPTSSPLELKKEGMGKYDVHDNLLKWLRKGIVICPLDKVLPDISRDKVAGAIAFLRLEGLASIEIGGHAVPGDRRYSIDEIQKFPPAFKGHLTDKGMVVFDEYRENIVEQYMSSKNSLAPPSPKEISRPTVKRLFAVSGNRCSFPKCTTALVDPQSGSIIGEICHIKGEKPGAARYDQNQLNEERQGFDNLTIMCAVHHKVIDDDEVGYTVERLVHIKKDHEARHSTAPPIDDATVERFVTVTIENSTVHGSVVTTHTQSGGQAAHTIYNYYGSPPSDEPIQLEGKLDTAVGLEIMNAIGCPGMRLTVICRSSRQARIHSAKLYVAGVDVMSGMQAGFGADFDYTPVEGSTQTLSVELIPLSPANSPEGVVLNRDDVCRFFYPLPMPSTTLALRAKPEQVSVCVAFFDGTEQTLLTGSEVQQVLDSVFQVYREKPGRVNVPVKIGVRVLSSTPPTSKMADLVGKTNPNYVPMAKPDPSGNPPAQ